MLSVDAAMRAHRPGRSIVIVPSRTIDKWYEHPAATQAYEERLLCLLLMLRDPGLSIVYLTSAPVAPAIVDYYLSLLPEPERWSARARLTLLSTQDASPRPLAAKALNRPRLLRAIRWAIPDPGLCQLMPYSTTELERDLALALDIPMYGADPSHSHHGTKSGGRELFARAGVPHPLGIERIATARETIEAIARLRAAKPELTGVIVKLDEATGGEGNAAVDLVGLPRPGAGESGIALPSASGGWCSRPAASARRPISAGWRHAAGSSRSGSPAASSAAPASNSSSPRPARSRSSRRTTSCSAVHNGHSYAGCRFPADPSYARGITDLAARVGRTLAGAGVIGRCAVDFVTVRQDDGRWRPYAIELNLRKGGTTHPFAALAQLTAGAYDAGSATFTTPTGVAKHYVASDHIESSSLQRLGQEGLLALVDRGALGFDRATGRGIVFHMLSSLDGLGRVGLTAVGDTPEEAQRLSSTRVRNWCGPPNAPPRRNRRRSRPWPEAWHLTPRRLAAWRASAAVATRSVRRSPRSSTPPRRPTAA